MARHVGLSATFEHARAADDGWELHDELTVNRGDSDISGPNEITVRVLVHACVRIDDDVVDQVRVKREGSTRAVFVSRIRNWNRDRDQEGRRRVADSFCGRLAREVCCHDRRAQRKRIDQTCSRNLDRDADAGACIDGRRWGIAEGGENGQIDTGQLWCGRHLPTCCKAKDERRVYQR